MAQIVEMEQQLLGAPRDIPLAADLMREAKAFGFSDRQIALLRNEAGGELEIRRQRLAAGIKPSYRLVDTCAAEFEAYTPYFYSSYAQCDQSRVTSRPKIMVLGSGPNRIGQGIEFDYCCVHTVQAVRELGFEAIMVNSNPETVSTDYDTSDKLYFEPLTFEDVMNIFENERPSGVIVQMGGQTPLNLAVPLTKALVPVLGTSSDSIDIAEDRKRTRDLLDRLNIRQPESSTAESVEEAMDIARRIGFPVMIRPSYVLGGRAMMVAYNENELVPFTYAAFAASPGFPVLIDRYLDRAVEVDVDVVCDGREVYIGGVMEHIEQAGVHSGDSACCTPPHKLPPDMVSQIEDAAIRIARALEVKGLMNLQAAVKNGEFYVLEINPRASRTVPYLSKATGVPLARMAAKVSAGKTLADIGLLGLRRKPAWCAVKEAVMPFNRFRAPDGTWVDTLLGPEMSSTGEVMGMDDEFGTAFAKSQLAAYGGLPSSGSVFVSLANRDKRHMVFPVKRLAELGFTILATAGTAQILRRHGVAATVVRKHSSGVGADGEPTVVGRILAGEIDLVINTPSGATPGGSPRVDGYEIRTAAVAANVPCITTVQGLAAAVQGIEAMRGGEVGVRSLQSWNARSRAGGAA
jgi:carbamoyl-phosphate synthase large subunit